MTSTSLFTAIHILVNSFWNFQYRSLSGSLRLSWLSLKDSYSVELILYAWEIALLSSASQHKRIKRKKIVWYFQYTHENEVYSPYQVHGFYWVGVTHSKTFFGQDVFRKAKRYLARFPHKRGVLEIIARQFLNITETASSAECNIGVARVQNREEWPQWAHRPGRNSLW